MTEQEMWENDTHTLEQFGIEQPDWVDSLTPADVIAIYEGGAASGAYMPAVTHYQANKTMAEHGDDVMQYIEDHYGDLPAIPDGLSWSQMASHFLAYGVEIFASSAYAQLEELPA